MGHGTLSQIENPKAVKRCFGHRLPPRILAQLVDVGNPKPSINRPNCVRNVANNYKKSASNCAVGRINATKGSHNFVKCVVVCGQVFEPVTIARAVAMRTSFSQHLHKPRRPHTTLGRNQHIKLLACPVAIQEKDAGKERRHVRLTTETPDAYTLLH
jgi:hypothetical protein